MDTQIPSEPWRARLYTIIFESDTAPGKTFDVLLIVLIVLSVVVVAIDSMHDLSSTLKAELYIVEWVFTVVFSVEYILRVVCVRRPLKYVFSFFGIVDLLGIAPTYLSMLIPGTQILLVVRVLRVLRIFRVLHLSRFLSEATYLRQAMMASRVKIFVFLFTVMTLVVVLGSLMYLVEGGQNGFSSIPKSIYWAIVTLTTVGYGDISPQTGLGQFLAAFIMILGYGIIAVPTGIVTAEMAHTARDAFQQIGQITASCHSCGYAEHDDDASYCKRCGHRLSPASKP